MSNSSSRVVQVAVFKIRHIHLHTHLLYGLLHRLQFSDQRPVQQQDQRAEAGSPPRTLVLGSPQDGMVELERETKGRDHQSHGFQNLIQNMLFLLRIIAM